jgi:hypothetical protein
MAAVSSALSAVAKALMEAWASRVSDWFSVSFLIGSTTSEETD